MLGVERLANRYAAGFASETALKKALWRLRGLGFALLHISPSDIFG
jgi:hypothetical protein